MPTGLRAMPALYCSDVSASAATLCRCFGFEAAGVRRDEAGEAVFAILRLGQVTLALHRADAPAAQDAFSVYVFIDDAAAMAELARAQGAALEGPEDMPNGCREIRFRDADGALICFAEDLRPGPDGPGL